MSKESRVAAKYKKVAKPYMGVEKAFKVLYTIFLVPAFICLVTFPFFISARRFLAIGFVVCFVPFAIFLTLLEQIEKKTKKPEMIFFQIEESISELDLSDSEIDELDKILEDFEKDICTLKIAGQLITITENLVVEYEEQDKHVFILTARTSQVSEITFDSGEGKGRKLAYYDLCTGDYSHIDIEFDTNEYPDGIEKVKAMLKEHFPHLEIVKESY